MKRKLATFLVCVMAMGLVACSTGDNSESSSSASSSSNTSSTSQTTEESSSEASTGDLSGAVATGGSTSVEKVIGALSEAFMEQNPDVDVTYDPTGSGAGITGAADGTLDIGLSSRALKDEETAEGLEAVTFALDGIAIVVNNENTITNLTMDQLKQLANGEITNWSEVGGPDAPVVFVGREAGSGTRDGFESVVGVEDVCKYEQELTSTGAVIAAVAANPNAFGYVSLASVDEKVKTLTIDDVQPTEATVLDGTYPIQRPFVFVLSNSKELSAQAQAFVDFATSTDASELIANAGAVPVAE